MDDDLPPVAVRAKTGASSCQCVSLQQRPGLGDHMGLPALHLHGNH